MTQLTVAVDVLSLLSVRLQGVILNFMVPSTDWHLEGGKRNSQIYWRERKEKSRSQLVTFLGANLLRESLLTSLAASGTGARERSALQITK